MPALHAIIIGAGPAGLAAALALHQQSTPASPIRVTVLELRPTIQTLGGAVNLTPLALRYLDALGAGARLRPRAAKVPHIDMLSHRTGASLGRLWPDVDAVRVLRQDLVEALVQTAREVDGGGIELRFGVRVGRIEEKGDAASADGSVVVHFTNTTTAGNGSEETLEGDLLLGCDGIHSFVRSSLVDSGRTKTYSGRATAYGFIPVAKAGDAGIAAADGSPAVDVSTLVTAQLGSLLVTFFEPARERLYLATVVAQAEREEGRDGRRATGEEKEALKEDFLRRFRGGGLVGLEEAVQRCEEWVSFPVYMLPPGGVWCKGRALLLGDAAHAVRACLPTYNFHHPLANSLSTDAAAGREHRGGHRGRGAAGAGGEPARYAVGGPDAGRLRGAAAARHQEDVRRGRVPVGPGGRQELARHGGHGVVQCRVHLGHEPLEQGQLWAGR